jgi:hypothetical protein
VLWPQELQEERSGLKEAATQEEQAWEAKEDRVKWRFRAGNVIADGRGQGSSPFTSRSMALGKQRVRGPAALCEF